jgi:hypothetical protein
VDVRHDTDIRSGLDLQALCDSATVTGGVRKADLRLGDCVLVHTRNSVYSITVLGGGEFAVSGGWFDRDGSSPAKLAINGCTLGGRAILTDLVAAPGLFLEFGNRVTTTRIGTVRVVSAEETAPAN